MGRSLVEKGWRLGRTVAVGLLAGVLRHRGPREVEARLAAAGPVTQASIVLATLALLFDCAVLAAGFGWPGMVAYILAVGLVVI